MTKIFVRERRKVEKGEKKARFRVVALSSKEIKIFAKHVRKNELELIAKEANAEIVYLPRHGTGQQNGRN